MTVMFPLPTTTSESLTYLRFFNYTTVHTRMSTIEERHATESCSTQANQPLRWRSAVDELRWSTLGGKQKDALQ